MIRHAQPERAEGPRRCISRTDLPLDSVGQEQAETLRTWAKGRPITAVYTSPARRCMQTAEALGDARLPLYLREDLREVDVGEWEDLTFDEIRRRWPEVYAARGEHMGTVAPPGGESFCQAGARLERALSDIVRHSRGEIAVVAHGGLLRGWLCGQLGHDPDRVLDIRQPWGGVTTVELENDRWTVVGLGRKPARYPGERERRALLDHCGTPEPVRAHGRAVAKLALRLAENGTCPVDVGFLEAACLLHDLCRRSGRKHPAEAQALLEQEGYPELGAVIARHHDLGPAPTPEMELLYLADKLVAGTTPVSLETRLAASREKCTGPEALAAWSRRYEDAKHIQQKWGGDRFEVDPD